LIAFALARDPEKARRLAEEIAQKQRHRITKPLKKAELKSSLGYICILAREGEIFSEEEVIASCRMIPRNSDALRELCLVDDVDELCEKLRKFEGFFSGVVASLDKVILFRDHVGHIPLVRSVIDGVHVLALERQALEFKAEPLSPGSILLIEDRGVEIVRWYMPADRRIEDPRRELADALTRAAGRLIPEKSSIAFSGGLDSSLLTYLALKLGKTVEPFVVGFEGCLDHAWAVEAADLLGLQVKVIELSEEDVRETAQILERFLPRKSLMDLAIASVFYTVSRNSTYKLVITGQGSDELFGGYWKYANALEKNGLSKVAELMKKDVENIHVVNIERDELASALAGSELIAPYLDREIYEIALSIDPTLKLRKLNGETIRKWILREAARELGLPKKLVQRPKKAAQYSSGILKRLMKIFRKS